MSGAPSFHDFAQSAADDEPDVRIHGDDIWEILLTSGTTAMPKAVMISHTYSYMAALSHALSYTRSSPVESQIRICTLLPIIYHVGDHAYVLSALLSGGSVVLGRGPSGAGMAAAVTAEAVTTLWGGSPQLLADVAREVEARPAAYDLTSLEVIIYGWNTLSPELVATLTRLCGGRVQFVGLFGQTEAIACHRFWPNVWPELHSRTAPQVNYVGVPAPLLDAAIMDAEDRLVPSGSEVAGEAVYRSPAMSSGYYLDEAATAEALRGGWFHSGDVCRYGEQGLRVMVDRFKDVIKSGGENVSSLRVEAVLAEHPLVDRAAVIGLSDDRWGETVTAVVVLAPGAEVDERELITFCRSRLAGYETPKHVVVTTELPTTVGGQGPQVPHPPGLRHRGAAMSADVRYESAGGVARITIDRPEVHNAFREQTMKELIEAFDRADAAAEVGVLVLAGAGRAAFSTGGDVGMEHAFDQAEGRRLARLLLRLAEAVRGTGKPVIAEIRGWCVGGGDELNLFCDFALAAESARFAHTDSRLGSSPI